MALTICTSHSQSCLVFIVIHLLSHLFNKAIESQVIYQVPYSPREQWSLSVPGSPAGDAQQGISEHKT